MNKSPEIPLSQLVIVGAKVVLGLLQVLYNLAHLIPARDRVVFLSRQSDHPTPDITALRSELSTRHGVKRIEVLARKMKSNRDFFYGVHLVRQVWHIAHARRIVLDSYSFLTSNLTLRTGTSVTQMWHAIGSLKRFGWDDLSARNPRRRQLAEALKMHSGNSMVIASSERAADNFASAFKTDRSLVAVAPLPRVDLIVNSALSNDEPRQWYDIEEPANVLLVAPTLHSEMDDPTNETVDAIAKTAKTRGWTVWESRHPVSDPRPRRFTTAELLTSADAFLTDKSSMIYEAGLMGIPGFLWVPPATQDAFFAESYPTAAELRPLIVESVDDLFAALADPIRRKAASEFAQAYVAHDESRTATERLAEIIANS